jgi:hypothetical protein
VHVGVVEVEQAVAVDVGHVRAHAGGLVLQAERGRDVVEAAVVVLVEAVAAEVVDHVEVHPAVLVEVLEVERQAVALAVLGEADLRERLVEAVPALVAPEEVARPVLRVVVRHRSAADHAAGDVAAGVEVDVAVVVDVGGAHAGDLGRVRPLQRDALAQAAAAVVPVDEDVALHAEREVLVAVAVEVREQDRAGVVEQRDARRERHVAHAAVLLAQEEPVGLAARLAEVDVLETVPVDVAERDAVHAEHRLLGEPVLLEVVVGRPAQQLLAVAGERAEDLAGQLAEDRVRREHELAAREHEPVEARLAPVRGRAPERVPDEVLLLRALARPGGDAQADLHPHPPVGLRLESVDVQVEALEGQAVERGPPARELRRELRRRGARGRERPRGVLDAQRAVVEDAAALGGEELARAAEPRRAELAGERRGGLRPAQEALEVRAQARLDRQRADLALPAVLARVDPLAESLAVRLQREHPPGDARGGRRQLGIARGSRGIRRLPAAAEEDAEAEQQRCAGTLRPELHDSRPYHVQSRLLSAGRTRRSPTPSVIRLRRGATRSAGPMLTRRYAP